MIDYNKEIVKTLNPILPTHYEMVLHSGLQVPCYSYMETNNYSLTGVINSTIGYSKITYQIKVWANRIDEIQKYALLADEALRKIGFKRIAAGELHDPNSTMIQKILTYECLALEDFN
jgi:hypothetical protein